MSQDIWPGFQTGWRGIPAQSTHHGYLRVVAVRQALRMLRNSFQCVFGSNNLPNFLIRSGGQVALSEQFRHTFNLMPTGLLESIQSKSFESLSSLSDPLYTRNVTLAIYLISGSLLSRPTPFHVEFDVERCPVLR